MQPLKDVFYNPDFYRRLSKLLRAAYPAFKSQRFVVEATNRLPPLELKQRIALTSELCRKYLPEDYQEALRVFYDIRGSLQENFANIFIPDYVARYGKEHFELSLRALKDFTRYSSSEFALRAFLSADLDKALRYVYRWAEDEDHHVRRLASEGTRPRLPWAERVPALNRNPALTLPLLQVLRADCEKYVQKSVANHLNDISKDHPDVMLDTVAAWDTGNAGTAWIIKHAARGLIKQGHPRALALFGAGTEPAIELRALRLQQSPIRLGEHLRFSFSLVSLANEPQKLIVDYKIHYVKKNGAARPKVFKLKQLLLPPGESVSLGKQHLFQDFTTRKHYAGKHALEIVVNGLSVAKKSFVLVE